MEVVVITTEYIKLAQFLKYINVVSSGAEAKYWIQEGKVKVNGEVATERGKKLRTGDQVEIEGEGMYQVSSGTEK
ncbi:MAG: S4 domain-containing protein YaaA [Epulopiscium sp.]|nr:S4 domain-containing protein YaaA [Candidatus Epulonipiscium sp.]